MAREYTMTQYNDANPEETREWLDALRSVIAEEGAERAHYLIARLSEKATRIDPNSRHASVNTPYRNTISPSNEERMPGDMFMDRKIRGIIRWNALAMVMRANKRNSNLGGHISTFSSAATLYDVGFNYFFQGPSDDNEGDLIYFQGHSSPGIYARSYLEGRLSEQQMDQLEALLQQSDNDLYSWITGKTPVPAALDLDLEPAVDGAEHTRGGLPRAVGHAGSWKEGPMVGTADLGHKGSYQSTPITLVHQGQVSRHAHFNQEVVVVGDHHQGSLEGGQGLGHDA